MTTKFDSVDYKVAADLVCAILYGDTTGLDAEEELELEDFLDSVVAENGNTHWAVSPEYTEDYARCEVTGKFGTVKTMSYFFEVE